MFLKEQTRQVQSELAKYCRSGNPVALPGADNSRLSHYRRLVYNIFDDSLQSAYPLTLQTLSDEEWDGLVHDFVVNHPSQSPQVWWMPRDFFRYISDLQHAIINKYPYLPNLMEMEWLEVELFMMEDIKTERYQDSQSTDGKLVINPEHRLVRFDYPVHLKNTGQIHSEDQGNYFLVMHREPASGKIIFTDVSVFFARMTEILNLQALSVSDLITRTCSDFNLKPNHDIEKQALKFLDKVYSSNLILGFER